MKKASGKPSKPTGAPAAGGPKPTPGAASASRGAG